MRSGSISQQEFIQFFPFLPFCFGYLQWFQQSSVLVLYFAISLRSQKRWRFLVLDPLFSQEIFKFLWHKLSDVHTALRLTLALLSSSETWLNAWLLLQKNGVVINYHRYVLSWWKWTQDISCFILPDFGRWFYPLHRFSNQVHKILLQLDIHGN